MIRAIGRIACWTVRMFGGKHDMRRLRKTERIAYMAHSCATNAIDKAIEVNQARRCRLCGTVVPVKVRKPKQAEGQT